MPFVYSHLVSLCCGIFLVGDCLVNALKFNPDASIMFGLVLPSLGSTLLTFSIFGLLEIGCALANPFGMDLEDFTICTIVEACAKSGLEVINQVTAPDTHDLRWTTEGPAANMGSNFSQFGGSNEISAAASAKKAAARFLRPMKEQGEDDQSDAMERGAVGASASLSAAMDGLLPQPHSCPLPGIRNDMEA